MYNLNEAAGNAYNNYENFNDAQMHNIPYFYAFFNGSEMGKSGDVAHHCEWDFGDATGRYLDAVILCSEASGIDVDTDIAKKYYDAIKWFISLGKNGLVCRPKTEFSEACVNTFDIRSSMIGLITYYGKTHDREALDIFASMVEGIKNIGVFYEDYFYIPYGYYKEEYKIEIKPYRKEINKADPCHYGGGVHIQPLVMYYKLVKDDDLLEFIGKIVRFIIKYSGVFDYDGSFFVSGYFGGEDGHFHSRMATVTGILEYAVVIGDKDIIDWCRKVYNFALSQGTIFGFFPEGLGKKPEKWLPEEYPDVARHTEICCTTDMIECALLFCGLGYDLYDDIEKFSNQLLKSQLNIISDIKDSNGTGTQSASFHKVAERYKGAFLGRTGINDKRNHGVYDNMGCCAAAGGRGVYDLWKNAFRYVDGIYTLDLWFDAEYEFGKTEILYDFGIMTLRVSQKYGGKLHVRIPGDTGISIKYCEKSYIDNGKYIIFENSGNDVTEILFDVLPIKSIETLCGEKFTVTWLHNKVIDIDKKGIEPLYCDTNNFK